MLVRKPVFPRIVFQIILYFLVLVVIAVLQFSGTSDRPGFFTERRRPFNPQDFVIQQAASGHEYNAAVSRWHWENYNIWSQQISQQYNEDLVISFLAEALNRDVFRTAISALPAAFLNSNQRTFESSVFLGQTEQASRLLAANDRDRINRIIGLIEDNPLELLKEKGIISFLYTRGNNDLLVRVVELISALELDEITIAQVPGIFEAYIDWQSRLQPLEANYQENPYSRLIERACDLISVSININSERSMVFIQNNPINNDDYSIDTEFNLYLAKALLDWAEYERNESWTNLARSLILSVLLQENMEDSPLSQLDPARINRLLELDQYIPQAVSLGNISNSWVWAWTLDNTINASMQNNMLSINVNFPQGESHYIIIRNIRPFSLIQIYGMNYPSDPQFERYDSSGWRYLAADQTLLIKMRHRSETENIRIFY